MSNPRNEFRAMREIWIIFLAVIKHDFLKWHKYVLLTVEIPVNDLKCYETRMRKEQVNNSEDA